MLRIRNTLTGALEEFKPDDPERVRIYVCGPTVYGLIHVGNSRPVIVFDAFRRYLEYRGYKVWMVQNFTDIDDKIINRANEWEVDFKDVAETFISEYYRDIDSLGVRQPNFSPKTSDFVKDIVEAIEVLIEKGYAYVSQGDVYFSVRKFERYGELSHRNLDEMRSGARIEISDKKKDPMDFALWKSSKGNEPYWESPWGRGRPGWHIECSVMSTKLLGSTLDIHAGGEDLIFPHHENERAQSEALTGKTFVKYWMHNGMIRFSGDKMSKSVGNIFTLREAVKRFGRDALKYFFLSKHYRSPIEFSQEAMAASVSASRKIQQAFKRFESRYEFVPVPRNDGWMEEQRSRFVESLDNDFNTPEAVAQIFELVNEMNSAMDKSDGDRALKAYHLTRREFCSVLGLFDLEELTLSQDVDRLIMAVLSLREDFRKSKQYHIADRIREELSKAGIEVKDTPQGTEYTVHREV